MTPLDANDVSAIVLFCAKHGLSPSVRAGGYGIAGWCVAGDVIIDMSLIKDIDIEAPIPISEDEGGGTTYTKLIDMPAPGSKGKGRVGATVKVRATGDGPISRPAQGADRPPIPGPPPAIVDHLAPRTGIPKRRREDCDDSETPPGEGITPVIVGGLNVGINAHLHAYDAASRNVGAFFRGPALPEIPGETPREPPLNRRRLHSPVAEGPPAPEVSAKTPALENRQLSGGSATSSGKVSTLGSGSSRESEGTTGTTPDGSPGSENPPTVGTTASAAPLTTPTSDPFTYLSQQQPISRPPIYGAGDPTGFNPATPGAASATFPSAAIWQRPLGPGPSSSIWSSGVSASAASPFNTPNPFMASSPFPPTPGSFAMPMSHMMGMGGTPPAEPIHSHAYVTFGAGMRQKEVDLYTAEHPLEGISRVTG